jgi:hypothetical protein
MKLPEIIEVEFPEGIPKFNIAFVEVPEFVTVAWLPGGSVVVVPIFTVAVVPGVPCSPLGIAKFKTALLIVPELVTVAFVPGALVVVVPIAMVAEFP